MSDALKMVKMAKAALDDKKGQDIKIIDIRQVTVIADYFLIADGANPNQVQAMVDNVEEVLGKAGYPCKQIEGYGSGGWVLMDYGDIIVHVFSREDRLFYDLERIWRDGKLLEDGELDSE
ncbi:MAG: ribosome silencing factor [Hungatella sp.]|jgi:ribosome-associated protein|nr:ribosome silencing factor [Hungatella sp.]